MRVLNDNELMNMMYVPDAGTDGSPAGGTKWFSMGSAAVPMGMQDKHDLLLRINPTMSTGEEEGDRQYVSLVAQLKATERS